MQKLINQIQKIAKIDLWTAFWVYLCTVCKETEWEYDPWQLEDWEFALEHDETLFIRSRGLSKTRDMCILAIFFLIIKIKQIWYAASDSQLEQATEYAEQNPFIWKATKSMWKSYGGYHMNVWTLTKKRSHSKRASILYFDEEEDMDRRLYKAALGTRVGMKFRKLFHAGTTQFETIFEDNYHRLSKRNCVRMTPITKCSWTTLERELAENYDGQPQWVIDQELLCIWTAAEGVILDNIVLIPRQPEMTPLVQYGIDINKVDIVVGVIEDEDNLWVVFEGAFDYIREPKKLINQVIGHTVETEQGGYNDNEARLLRQDVSAYAINWRKEEISVRMTKARSYKHIYINKETCPNTYYDITTTGWDPRRPGLYSKTDRHPCHYWDAFLHAVGASPGEAFGSSKSEEVLTEMTAAEHVNALKRIKNKTVI